MSAIDLIDLILRSCAAGVCLILAVMLGRHALKVDSARFGVLFALGAASYALATASLMQEHAPLLANTLKPFAILTPVFFWWFGLSLFCDHWRWSATKLIPLILVMTCILLQRAGASLPIVNFAHIISELIHIGLVIHVLYVINHGSSDDLVESRRQGRAAWVMTTGIMVIGAALISLLRLKTTMPDIVFIAEAGGLLLASLAVSAWALKTRSELFPDPARSPASLPPLGTHAHADQRLIANLRAEMDAGLYRTPGLTVGKLADQLRVREHRLRAVINRQLGYRNFAAFLNEYRIAAAKNVLADPSRSQDQILIIALELGYNSIAPFNRAFRELVGDTPTGYRRNQLQGSAFTPEAAE